MPRLARRQQHVLGSYYHLMNRGHNREVIFQTDQDHAYFLELVERYRQRFPLRIYHYCLMNNHFHLLVRCENPEALSPCLAGMLRAYVHYFHRRYGFVGHLWQGRFKSPAVAVEEYFLSCARYLERNPVTAGLVQQRWDYRWSSCPAYALGVSNPLLSYNVWYQSLAGNAAQRQVRWREFLVGDDPHEEAVHRGDWTVGEEDFRRRMQRSGARPGRRRGRPRKPPLGQERLFPEFFAEEQDR